jgi:hypothetical protein
MDSAYRASSVIPDAKWRQEKANAHRQNNDHRRMHLVNANGFGDRKYQWSEKDKRPRL